MGILLTFMFVWNMIGATILIPALSHFRCARWSINVRFDAGTQLLVSS